MVERHWDGIAAYCCSKNKVALGFVEGLNNRLRVLQRWAYGDRDEEYFRLKVLTCLLPKLQIVPPPFHPKNLLSLWFKSSVRREFTLPHRS